MAVVGGRVRVGTVLGLVVAVAAGCSGGDGAKKAAGPEKTAASAVTVPEAEPMKNTLLTAGPQTGNGTAKATAFKKGRFWLEFHCAGGGAAEIRLGPEYTFQSPCSGSGEGGQERSGVDGWISADMTASPVVQAPATVTWALRILQ